MRFDVLGKEELKEYDVSPFRQWTKKEDEYLKDCIRQKKTTWETYKHLDSPNRTHSAMVTRISFLKNEMGDKNVEHCKSN